MNTESGFDIDWEVEKVVEVESPQLTRSQLIIIEDEFDEVFRMSPETLENLRRLQQNQAFQFITGFPAPQ